VEAAGVLFVWRPDFSPGMSVEMEEQVVGEAGIRV